MKHETGLLVHVLRSTLGDSTNGGVTARHDEFVLVGDGVEGPFEPHPREAPGLRLVRRSMGRRGEYLHAEPIDGPENADRMCGPMFGGNFVTTSDSRFPNLYPIPVHDRWETAESAEMLSR